ncbi:MAG: MerR family transcriptional regulator [Candidatus Poribacteria bacterium]|nr:MerR family transcriptional regulator [Candidatus Poribacteria bacterium]
MAAKGCSRQTSNDEQKLLRIGEIASLTDTTLRTLHYYEELGLITPAKRTKGGFRMYHPDALKEVQYIQYLRGLGLELPQVQSVLEARRVEEGESATNLRCVVEKEVRRVKSQIYRYCRLRDELEATLEMLRECESRGCAETPGGVCCPNCPVVCDRELVPTIFQPTDLRIRPNTNAD